jgi:thymidylate kinase
VLVAIEGIHGAGKTTLAKGLAQKNPDISVLPEGPMMHSEIVALDLGQGGHLLNNVRQSIALEKDPGKLYVTERWVTSALSYRWALDPSRYEQIAALIRKLIAERVLLVPDVTVVLACEPRTALPRCTESLPWLTEQYLIITANYYEKVLTDESMCDIAGKVVLFNTNGVEDTLNGVGSFLSEICMRTSKENGAA